MIRSLAYVVERPGDGGSLRYVDIDEPRHGEVRVRMVASGVCSTDQHVAFGTSLPHVLPVVLGHEGAGVVDAVGSGVESISLGDHVVFGRSAPCGTCRRCHDGLAVDCDSDAHRRGLFGIMDDGLTRVSIDGRAAYPLYGGTLSEFMTVRASHVVPIAKDLPLELMCLAGCAVVTGLGAVLNTVRVGVGDSVLIVGCGGVGLSVVQGARIAGATTIVAVDTSDESLDLALAMGATHSIATGPDVDLVNRVLDLVDGGVDVAVEVVGSPGLVVECLECTRAGGTTVMVGVPPAGSTLTVPPMTLIQNRRLVGCRGGSAVPTRDIPRVAALYRSGALHLEPLVTRTLPLERVADAIDALSGGLPGRSVVVFDG